MTVEWCLGVFSSGSTWLFNTLRAVASKALPDHRIMSNFVYSTHDIIEADDPRCMVILKSHYTEAAAEAKLRDTARRIWISLRDPRDCVASLMRYEGLPFADALTRVEHAMLACARFVTHPRALVFRYEDGFTDDPDTLGRIERGLGVTLSDADRSALWQATRRNAIEAFIEQFDTLPTAVKTSQVENVYDTVTHWHSHHANRSGTVGRWREELGPDQVTAIEARVGAMMNRFGYEPAAAGGAIRRDPGFALPDADRDSLLGALAAFDHSGPITIVVASDNHSILLDNWLAHVDALDIRRFVIVAMDDALHGKLLQAGIATARCHFDGSRADFWLRRMLVWDFVLNLGYDFIHSDTDAVWLRDPMPYLARIANYDFLCSQGTIHPETVLRAWGFILCAGFFWLRAGPASEAFMAAMLADPVRIRDSDDQVVLNEILLESGAVWTTEHLAATREEYAGRTFLTYPEVVSGRCEALGFRMGLLPHDQFPRLPRSSPAALVNHALRPGDNVGRLDRMRACGCWRLDNTAGKLMPYPDPDAAG